jgi:proteasome accessory factor C
LKLGATGLNEVRPIAMLSPPQALVDLFEAVRTQAAATFSYRNDVRRVAPAGLWFRFGHWYLVAWDLDREAVRTFRVDRIVDEVALQAPGSAVLPEGIDVRAALPDQPWHSEGDDHVITRIRVDAMEGPRVAEEVGRDKVERRHDDGSVELALPVAGFSAIRPWILGLVDHAEILDPPEFRKELVQWLEELAEGPPRRSRRRSVLVVPAPEMEEAEPTGGRGVPGRETSQRLRRLLAVVGWLARVGEAPIADVAQRFNIRPDQLIAELELAACCGVPPYTPDTLMEIEVSETSVRAFLPPEFARPRRLTPAEGFAVAASARLILAVPGPHDDALGRALAKLDAALGSREAMGVDVDAPPSLTPIRQASDAGLAVEIDYHSASRDESTTRVVEPVQVITTEGHWYLDAFCHRAGDMRRFRIDRISDVRPTGVAGEHSSNALRTVEDAFVPGPGAVEVQLHLGPDAQWVAESVPVRGLARAADGTVTDVVLDVAGMAWFERLLLQLGPGSYVTGPPELTDLAARAARRVLELYRNDGE